MPKAEKQTEVKSATPKQSPLAPGILIALRARSDREPINYCRADKSVGDGWVLWEPGIAAPIFWRTFLSPNTPGAYNLQAYYGSSKYLWLAGEKSNQHVFISESQGDLRCNWFIERSTNPYNPGYRLRSPVGLPDKSWVAYPNGKRDGVPWWILQLIAEGETDDYTFLLQYFDDAPDMSWAPVTYARLLGQGHTLVGNPLKSEVYGVDGIEDQPPLGEVWYVQKTQEPSWYVIVVVTDLGDPRCLAGGSKGSQVYLTKDPNDADAQWFIESSGTDLFKISKSATGQGPWLTMSGFQVSLSQQSSPWVIQTLFTAP